MLYGIIFLVSYYVQASLTTKSVGKSGLHTWTFLLVTGSRYPSIRRIEGNVLRVVLSRDTNAKALHNVASWYQANLFTCLYYRRWTMMSIPYYILATPTGPHLQISMLSSGCGLGSGMTKNIKTSKQRKLYRVLFNVEVWGVGFYFVEVCRVWFFWVFSNQEWHLLAFWRLKWKNQNLQVLRSSLWGAETPAVGEMQSENISKGTVWPLCDGLKNV